MRATDYLTVISGIQLTGGEVLGVTRGPEVLFSTGESTHDFMPALLADDAKLAASCADKGDAASGDLVAMLRGTVFEGAHNGIPNASIKLSWRGDFKPSGKDSFTYSTQERDLTSDAAGNWYSVRRSARARHHSACDSGHERSPAPVTVRIPKERPSAGVDVEVPPA